MITLTRINETTYRAAAPLDGIECTAATPEAASAELQAILGIKRIGDFRIRRLRALTTISFDPRVRAYVATCAPAGLEVQGFTRQDAWEGLLREILAAEQAAADRSSNKDGHSR